jgi:Spy/CpxP family protein refolding chaperone
MKTASKLVLIALVISLPLMAFAQQGPREGRGMMMEQLDLTDDQQAQVQELRLDHQKEMITLQDEMHSLHNQMKLLLTEDKPSSSEMETLAGKIGTASRNIALAKANHRLDVRKLLTDEQKVKFDMMTLHRGDHRGHRGADRPAPPMPPDHPRQHRDGSGDCPKERPAR